MHGWMDGREREGGLGGYIDPTHGTTGPSFSSFFLHIEHLHFVGERVRC